MPLKLNRPIVCFDLETTGTNPIHDRIIEVAALRIAPGGAKDRYVTRVNPGCPIPPASTKIHGIRDEDVEDAPSFADIAPQLDLFLHACDLTGFSIARFDIPLLTEEFRRVGIRFDIAERRILDSQKIFHMREPRNLTAALKFYCGETLEGAHGAEADTEAAWKVLEGQLETYEDLPDTVIELEKESYPERQNAAEPQGKLQWQDGKVVLAFGKQSGRSLQEMARTEPNYLKWMLNREFSDEAKKLVRDALNGTFPKPRK